MPNYTAYVHLAKMSSRYEKIKHMRNQLLVKVNNAETVLGVKGF